MASITGQGLVSSLGIGMAAHRKAWKDGASGLDEPTLFEPSEIDVRCGEVGDYKIKDYLRTRQNYLDRHTELACISLREAVESTTITEPRTCGLVCSSVCPNSETEGMFMDKLLEKGARFVPPILFPHTYANTTASLISIEFGLGGFHQNFTSGALSGISALICASHALACGSTENAAVCGTEALSEMSYTVRLGNSIAPPSEASASVILCARKPISSCPLICGTAFAPDLKTAVETSMANAGISATETDGILLTGTDASAIKGLSVFNPFEDVGDLGGTGAVYSVILATELLSGNHPAADHTDVSFCAVAEGGQGGFGCVIVR